MPQAFVSYSHVDQPFIKSFVERLGDMYENLDIWYDKRLRGGDIWWQEILKQIAGCDIFIYLLSNESVQSPHCQAEFREARRLKKQIITVQIRDRTELTPELSDIQYVDMKAGPDDIDAQTQLVAAINKQLDLLRSLPASSTSQTEGWPTPRPDAPEPQARISPDRDIDTPILGEPTVDRVRPSRWSNVPLVTIGAIIGLIVIAAGILAAATLWSNGSPTDDDPVTSVPLSSPTLIGYERKTVTALGIDFPRHVNDLWVAIEDEGVYFKLLADEPMLAGMYIAAILPRTKDDLCVDRQVYFGTYYDDGLWVYDPYDPEGENWTEYDETTGLSGSTVTSLLCADSEHMLIGTSGGLDRLSVLTGEWEHFDLPNLKWQHDMPAGGEEDNFVRDLALNPFTGEVWAITHNSLFQPGDPPNRYALVGTVNPIPIQVQDLTALCFTADGWPILGNNAGEVAILPGGLNSDEQWRDISIPSEKSITGTTDLACLSNGKVIATTRNDGYWVYDRASDSWSLNRSELGFFAVLATDEYVLLASSNGVYRIPLE